MKNGKRRIATLVLGASLVVGAVSACSSGGSTAAKHPKAGWTASQEREFLKAVPSDFDARCDLRVVERNFPTHAKFVAAAVAEISAAAEQARQECQITGWRPADEREFLKNDLLLPNGVRTPDGFPDQIRCALPIVERVFPTYAAWKAAESTPEKANQAATEIGQQCQSG